GPVLIPQELWDVCSDDPGLPAAERFSPKRRRLYTSEMLLRLGMDYTIRPGGPGDAAMGGRSLAHSLRFLNEEAAYRVDNLTQHEREIPSFLGYCFSDDCKATGDWEEGIPFQREKEIALEEIHKHRYGVEPPATTDMRAYAAASEEKKKSTNMKEIRKRRFEAVELMNSLFPTTHRIWKDRSRIMKPDLVATTANAWLGTTPDGFYLPKAYEQMNVLHTKYYTDGGMLPFMDQFCIDLWRAGQTHKKFWYMLLQSNSKVIRREQILSLSRNVDGLGYFAGLSWGTSDGRNAEINAGNKMLEMYGDFFLRGKRRNDVALLYSYTTEAFNIGGFGADLKAGQSTRNYEAYFACMRARRPANIVVESEIAAGGLKDYKVLIMTNVIIPFPEKVTAEIEKFAAAGGLVLMDEECTISLKGAKKTDLSFRRWTDI
ncbi:MAG: hypothetical protein QF662_08305, partial [Phycisphaerae bacterium]|nr:hypothetical protein [Phycisphaerae bacterium]